MAPTKPIIYQLVVRHFGNVNVTNRQNGSIEINGCGRFAEINANALAALKGLGVGYIWLTGCLRQATLTDYSAHGLAPDDADIVKGIAGSFYAVKDYFDVCPDYATDIANRLSEFNALVERVHAAGLKVLIDFVGNHVARSYRSLVRPGLDFGAGDDTSRFFWRDNGYFYLVDPPGQKLRLPKPTHWQPPVPAAQDGEFAPEDGGPGRPPKATGDNGTLPNPDVFRWYDTIKLNYGYDFVAQTGHYSPQPKTWALMDEVLAYWQARGVDGFRCDFAHYIPGEAWKFLISQARRRNADAFFFAEAYPFHGSGDPITDMSQLVDAGFDAVYHDDSYDRLKLIYQGREGQDHYDRAMVHLPSDLRTRTVEYLENHDERRIASPIVSDDGPDGSGFGSSAAGYQLAPLQYLYGSGPVLMLNGQEVGETGSGIEGYGGNEGRTTLFDYWCMPEFAKWVNGHKYNGGGLSTEQKRLRRFYADLLALCGDPSVRGNGYWGLKYFNRPERFSDCPAELYSFARFQDGSGRLMLVVANFRPSAATQGRLRVPRELGATAGLAGRVAIRLRLDRDGAQDSVVANPSLDELVERGFEVSIPDQTAHVYVVN